MYFSKKENKYFLKKKKKSQDPRGHSAQKRKMKFSIKDFFSKCMSMINVTKSADSCGFDHIY